MRRRGLSFVFQMVKCKFSFSDIVLVKLSGSLWGQGKCPIFPGEVGIPSVTRPPVSGHHPCGEMWWVMGFWPMRFQCCPLQDAARSAVLYEVTQVFSPGFAGMGGGRWEGTGLFVHLWSCSLPVMVLPNLSCHTCQSPSLSLSVDTVCTCLLNKMFLPLCSSGLPRVFIL